MTLVLSACTSLQQTVPHKTSRETPIEWPLTAQKIDNIRNWKLIGKIGIRTPEESLTVAINQWHQAESSFVIDLSSTFFGLGASKLQGNPHLLTIIEAGEQPVSSYEPDLLIYQALGFPLPISLLPWWVKGIPVADSQHELEFDAQGYPASLIQNGWHLTFSKHTLIDGLPLPGKIKLERDKVRIILAIKQWTRL
ncbi:MULTISPECIES: lipoprotein insertase outer membrane protein LolB [unclassified Oleiphilus]|uniref:lipoprotein insertase outer membrane protein LolB n=1 Tax=unclassified Oleiphilus TaxID=2631174 RepID=UPI0018D36556|nr:MULTISPECIES: lipoprotein insertase outer membrane protein LolB [unclassified Oleiphilus]